MGFSGHWYLPTNPAKCAAINQTVDCPMGYYGDVQNLPDKLKLTPNLDITASTCIALILSACLIIDKIEYHFYHKRRNQNSKAESRFWLKSVHTIESLLQTISDQQVVAGVAMLLLSGVTHLNTLINIPDLVYKGKMVAANRLIAIVFQLVMSGIIFFVAKHTGIPDQAQRVGRSTRCMLRKHECVTESGPPRLYRARAKRHWCRHEHDAEHDADNR
ncbi:hypothetical protein K504DRAFT_508473 [Pleomassaria siparia CBS 279.74]|uniref:Uncharacterized protein n=1 Tax=Pleomassaria siparia CBS 279.74 TaxID=1314801 RepID=A0A6G1JR22_9PLEO|nr:hypothetical protein K504DRAFT_508473 [Pleomassaria siparia CBS 279.74]